MLAEHGFQFTITENGDEALAAYKNGDFDVALIDWRMPPSGGLILCKEIREYDSVKGGFCYIIMVTAKKSIEDEVRAFDAGVNDFVKKPFVEDILIARMKAGKRIVDEIRVLTRELRKCRE